MGYAHHDLRRPTREVAIGDLVVGGQHPIAVQSMTNTNTWDAEATVEQIQSLSDGRLEIVRVTVPKAADLRALPAIRERIMCRWCATFTSITAWHSVPGPGDRGGASRLDKIRINPGNIGGHERFCEVVHKAGPERVPMRIGVNSGSLEKSLVAKRGFPATRRPWLKARSATSRPRRDSATSQMVAVDQIPHTWPPPSRAIGCFAEQL